MMTVLPTQIDPPEAARILHDWGFIAHSDQPDQPGPSFLLVAIRPRPTLAHYDPEVLEYWVNDHGRGVPATLDRRTRMPLEVETTWGMVRIADRLHVTNEWLSFGGQLSAQVIDGDIIVVLRSSAPLLLRGGHSQGWDLGAPSVGAFFARVRAAAGYDHRFETMEAAADPLARYGCFVADFARMYRRSETLQHLDADLWRLVQHEEHRLRTLDPGAWEVGTRLLAALDAASRGL
jgi:hypothetical protein